MARPTVQIDKEVFEKLCGMQCTLIEIADFFNCTDDTINNWCRKIYDDCFSGVFKKYSVDGKISLRRTQFALSKTSPAMAIFLGKNYLGQTDKTESLIEATINSSNKVLVEDYLKAVKK